MNVFLYFPTSAEKGFQDTSGISQLKFSARPHCFLGRPDSFHKLDKAKHVSSSYGDRLCPYNLGGGHKPKGRDFRLKGM